VAGVAEKRKFFRVLRLDSPVGTGIFTEKATGTLFFIDSKIAIPGKSVDGTHIHTRFGLACNAEKNLFLLRPIG
jgi:hypothetical protein